MIVTKFLPTDQYSKFADWLCNQDTETQQCYFGTAASDHLITTSIERILSNPDNHYFLVAFDHARWLGAIHMATHLNENIEFGIIVDSEYRGQGVADRLMDEGITWAQNRRYKQLYLHCLSWNLPIKHLCKKYGLEIHNLDGSGEVNMQLPLPSMISVGKEFATMNRNIFTKLLETTWDTAK
jgi:RimJ/RimL family protein N-acetyltransferase